MVKSRLRRVPGDDNGDAPGSCVDTLLSGSCRFRCIDLAWPANLSQFPVRRQGGTTRILPAKLPADTPDHPSVIITGLPLGNISDQLHSKPMPDNHLAICCNPTFPLHNPGLQIVTSIKPGSINVTLYTDLSAPIWCITTCKAILQHETYPPVQPCPAREEKSASMS